MMKIQINSLEALERLIGGDNELEISIRNSVVQNFTNKHLKGVVNEYVEKGYLKALQDTISKEVFESVSGWNSRYTLTPAYKDVVAFHVRQLVRTEIEEVLTSLKESGELETLVTQAVSYQILREIEKVNKELIAEEAKKLIQEKFK